MPIIYRTARLPIVYKARLWSAANILHIICTIIKYVSPILACLFYINHHSGDTFVSESPSVIPGNVIYFYLKDMDERTIGYPSEVNSNNPLTEKVMLMVHPEYDLQNRVTSWKINARVYNEGASPEPISVVILFNFTVNIRKWATNTIQAVGSFSKTFINQVNRVVCFGDLVLEQTEMIEFRGSFSNTDLTSYDISNYDYQPQDLISARDNLSTLFYVDWDEPLFSFGDNNNTFELELVINVKDLTIFHSIPLVSSIESFLIMFLATYLLSALILDTLQGFVFRHGIIKTWAIPLYQKLKKKPGSI